MKKESVEYLLLVTLFPVYLSLMCLSLLVRQNALLMLSLVIVCGAILLVILCFNLFFLFRARDRYGSSRQLISKFSEQKSFDSGMERRVLQKPSFFLALAYCYIIILFASLFLLGFATVSFLPIHFAYIIPGVVLALLLATLTTAIVSLFVSERKRSVAMSRKSEVFSLFLGFFPSKRIRVLIEESNDFAIFRRPFHTTLRLGANLLLYLSPEELKSLLAYETSVYRIPVLKSYHRLSRQIERMSELTEPATVLNFINVLFFRVLLMAKERMCAGFLLSKDHWEGMLRDSLLAEANDEKSYLSAFAKKRVLDLYDGLCLPTAIYKECKDYPEDYFVRVFNQKYAYILRNEDRFASYLQNDPAFRKKRKDYRIEEISLKASAQSPAYRQEAQEEVLRLSRKHLQRWRKEYRAKRYRRYLVYFDLARLSFAEDKALPLALDGLLKEKEGKRQDSLKAYQAALREDGDCVLALFHKGLLLLQDDDENGIADIDKATEIDSNFLEEGLVAINSFRLRNGLLAEKELQDDCNIERIKARLDEKELTELTSNSVMCADSLSEEAVARIVDLAERLEDVQKVKIDEQITKEGVHKHHVGFLLAPSVSEERAYLAFAAFYYLLDDFKMGGKPIRFFLTRLRSEKKYDVYSSYLNGKLAKVVYERKEERRNG